MEMSHQIGRNVNAKSLPALPRRHYMVHCSAADSSDPKYQERAVWAEKLLFISISNILSFPFPFEYMLIVSNQK